MSKAKTILSEIAFTCKRPIGLSERSFEKRSRSIMSGVSAFFGNKVKTEGYWKISICINSDNDMQHMKVVGGVLRYNIEYDISHFLSLAIDDQKIQMLDLVDQTLGKIFSVSNLNDENLSGLKNFILERQFVSLFSGPASRREGITAVVLCEQGFDQAEIFIILKSGNKEIKRIPLLITSPEEFIFNVYLNKVEWLSDNKLELIASNGETFSICL